MSKPSIRQSGRQSGRFSRIAITIGLIIVAVNVGAALLAPVIAPYAQTAFVGSVWEMPSAAHWFGLDNLGRDMFSRILFGARYTIGIAFLATLFAFVLGVTAGFGVALAPRWVDLLVSRLVDALMAFPTLILALVILSVLGSSIPLLIFTVAIIASTRVFRVSRALASDIVVLDYVEVARMRGETTAWLLFREILPAAVGTLVTEFGLRFCFAVLFIASLSFLGLGIQPPYADWGSMVRDNAQAISNGGIAPLIPAAAIALLAIGVNLALDGYIARRLSARRQSR